MEIETAARKHLLNQGNVTNLVSKRVWKFGEHEPLENTGLAALVLRRNTGWTKPGRGSQEYPMLVIECLSDWSRTPEGQVIKDDAADRAYAVYREVDRILHQVDREVRYWPEGDKDGLLVLGCFRGSEPTEPVDKWGVKVVRVTYDVQVVH